MTAQVVPLADGWFRCTINGIPDATGGNNLRLDLYMNDDITRSSIFTGSGNSGLLLRNLKVSDN